MLGPLRAGRNLVYFAESILGVRLNPAQKRWYYLLAQAPDSWSWVYRIVAHVAANQIGKTLGLAIALLWAAHNKIGTDNRNWDFWLNSPYKWYHLAPSQGQADFVRQDMALLVKGAHPAQYDKETAEQRPFRWLEGLATEVKFDKYYPGFLLWNGAQIHFRTSEDRASAIHGVRANGCSVDEAAQEDNLKVVLNQVLKLRVISTGGPIWMVSTPDGINDWYEIVTDILNVFTHKPHPRMWEAPEPNERKALVWSHVQDNVGYGLTQEQVDYMEGSIDESKEQSLRGAFLNPVDAFFVPQDRIMKTFRVIPEEQEPQAGRRYVAFWDPSVGNDPTVLTVLDVTGPEWVGVFQQRWETPMGADLLISEMHKVHAKWNGVRTKTRRSICTTGFDATSMGGLMLKQLLRRLSPKRAVNFAGHVKMDALTDLRAAMFGRLLLPASWLRHRREILSYRIEDKNLVQDCVMSLAGAAYIASRSQPGQTKEHPFDPSYSAPQWR